MNFEFRIQYNNYRKRELYLLLHAYLKSAVGGGQGTCPSISVKSTPMVMPDLPVRLRRGSGILYYQIRMSVETPHGASPNQIKMSSCLSASGVDPVSWIGLLWYGKRPLRAPLQLYWLSHNSEVLLFYPPSPLIPANKFCQIGRIFFARLVKSFYLGVLVYKYT